MDIEFPVALCPKCLHRGPVFISDTNSIVVMESEQPIAEIQVVICPECDSIINDKGDLEIEWFPIEDAKYFGYKVVEDD